MRIRQHNHRQLILVLTVMIEVSRAREVPSGRPRD